VPRADVPGRLLRGSEAVRTVAGLVERRLGVVPATLGLEAVQELLACERQEVAATLASACARFEHCADSVVLHGRYCPGFVVAGSRGDPEDVRVIGWTAAAFGPAEFDVGWFVGELEELAAAREAGDLPGARLLRSAAAAFVSAYLARRGGGGSEAFRRDCGSYAAVKVVAHLAEFARYFTLDRGAADLQLSLAERLTDPAWAARILAEEAQ
jgi:aminoglycoside phosphotransferase (APT) family kinase protein